MFTVVHPQEAAGGSLRSEERREGRSEDSLQEEVPSRQGEGMALLILPVIHFARRFIIPSLFFYCIFNPLFFNSGPT